MDRATMNNAGIQPDRAAETQQGSLSRAQATVDESQVEDPMWGYIRSFFAEGAQRDSARRLFLEIQQRDAEDLEPPTESLAQLESFQRLRATALPDYREGFIVCAGGDEEAGIWRYALAVNNMLIARNTLPLEGYEYVYALYQGDA